LFLNTYFLFPLILLNIFIYDLARGECGNSSNSQDLNNMINNSSSSLNEIINGLKYKYVELQEKNKNDLKVMT